MYLCLQYRCALVSDNIENANKVDTLEDLVVICGYKSADDVRCQVKASTAIGYGPTAEGQTTIICGGKL